MIFLGIGNRLPEHLDLGNTQSPGSLLASQFLGALGGMVGQQSLVLGVADDCLNCAKAPRGDTSSAGRLSATSTSASFGRLQLGRASCRERGSQSVSISVSAASFKKKTNTYCYAYNL